MNYLVFILTALIIALLIVSYIVYPVFISFIKYNRKSDKVLEFNPNNAHIHVLLACYNEEEVIEDKIRNSFSINYPVPYTVYVIIDKSDDRTFEIATRLKNEFNELVIFNKGYRKGKNDSLNYFYDKVKVKEDDILLMTDANTFFEENSIMHLWDDLTSGAIAVGGSMSYSDKETASAESEGLYWRYEEWIRKNESSFGRNITMNGGNMAMLAKYYEEIPSFAPNDFYIPLSIVSEHKCTFNSKSIGKEKAILCKNEELNRKTRMANRQMSAIMFLWSRLSTITRLQVLFHKVVRWFSLVFCFIILILISLRDICNNGIGMLSYVVYIGSLLFCVILLYGIFTNKKGVLSTLNYAILVHYYAGKGALSALFGKKVSTWKKADSNRNN